jgi:TldD protein
VDAERLLNRAEEHADAAIAYELRADRIEVEAVNGELRLADPERHRGAALRLLKDGSWRVVHADQPDGRDPFKTAVRVPGRGTADLPDEPPAATGRHDWTGRTHPLDALDEVTELALDLSRDVPHDCEVRCVSLALRYRILTTWGTEVEARLHQTSFGVRVSDRGEHGREEYHEREGATAAGPERFLERAETLLDRASRRLRDLLRAEPGPDRVERAVLDPELLGVLVHEAFGHATEGDLVARGESILRGKLGERVASEAVTIVDDPTEPGPFGAYPFDDEGVEARRTVLVEDGVLRAYLTDLTTAAELDAPPTGNGRAETLGDHVQVRMSVTYVEPGDADREELFKEAGDGSVYLLGSKGGQTDTTTGHFQFSAKLGYVLEDGEPARPVRDVGLTGHTLRLLRGVLLLSRERRLHAGYCGKGGQLVPVSDGGPHALIEGPFNLRSG